MNARKKLATFLVSGSIFFTLIENFGTTDSKTEKERKKETKNKKMSESKS